MQSTCVCNTCKMEYDKINNLLCSESETYLNLLLENMLKLIVYLIRIMKINQLDLKHQIRFRLRSDLCDYADAYILVNGTITVNYS